MDAVNPEDLMLQVSTLLNCYEVTSNDGNLAEETEYVISLLLSRMPNITKEMQEIHQTLIGYLEELRHLNVRNSPIPHADLQLLNHRPRLYHTERSGRPKYFISKEAMIGLREMNQSWTKIAAIFSVSRWTMFRRAREYNISDITAFTTISDEDLLEIARQYIDQQSRLVGFSLLYGYLQSIGIRVQQRRVRQVIRQIDPVFSQLRWAAVIHRRTYNVRAPNSLWHVDGHHSLIKYGFVFHGAIDGYSRMITFLKCSTNNRSDTVEELFVNATEMYGVPSRIRTDFGGENVRIWELMESYMGRNRGSALRGSSTQNQRIERLWRDVFRCVSSTFYYLFQSMSESGILDIDNILHKIALHYVFVPRLNKSLRLGTTTP